MSRSQPTTQSSPATRYFDWSAERGELNYYDKEKGENIAVKMPFPFLVLDEVSQVGGGTKHNGVFDGYWSNAVKDLNTQIITVRNKAGIVDSGLYADKFKERKGFHYVKGLYIAFYDDNKTLQIGYLKLKGSALGAWFEFTKTHKNLYQGAFVIKSKSDPIEGDKSTYYVPVFAHKADVSPESDEAAKALDVQLQDYFKQYFAHNSSEPVTEHNGNGHVDVQAPAFAASASATNEPPFKPYTGPEPEFEDDDTESIPF